MKEQNYAPTQTEIKEFAIHKKTGNFAAKPLAKREKPTNGKLVLILPSGAERDMGPDYYDKPFPLLQTLKKRLIQAGLGYTKDNLKIKYL